jgi:lipid II:glycine glycyltransferase (peptidoglycan interpeptide bridge formation enzyme)
MDRFLEPRNTLCVDLRPSEDAILAQMKPKGRYNIRVAQRHGVSVIEDSSDKGVEDFVRIYKRTAARQEMAVKPPGYFRELVSMLGSSQRGSVFFAEYDGKRLAAAVVVYFGQRATYFFGGSLAWHRRVMAPYLLHFEIMRNAKTRGKEWYDLWGIAPAGDPGHRWQNISVFKRKFGGVELNFVPALDCIFDTGAYNDYLAAEAPDQERI